MRRRLVLTVYAGILALAVLTTTLSLIAFPPPVCHGWVTTGSNGAVTQWMPKCHAGRLP